MTMAASIATVLVTPGSRDTAARTWPDSENGATTSRSACRSPCSGATFADPEVPWSGPADSRAAGTANELSPVPALPPSIGTTGEALRPGAGRVAGTTGDDPGPAAGPPAVATITPASVPATASTPMRTGTWCRERKNRRVPLAPPDAPSRIRRQHRRAASVIKCIASTLPHGARNRPIGLDRSAG